MDLMQYKPKMLVGDAPLVPEELGMETAAPDGLAEELMEMTTAEKALRRPIHLPPKARFCKGPAIHIQFDGGA